VDEDRLFVRYSAGFNVLQQFMISEDKLQATIALSATVDLRSVESLHAALLAAFARHQPIRVDAAEVERMSTVAVQLLVSSARSAAAAGIDFKIAAPSRAVCDAFKDLGLAQELEQWSLSS
jgi:anti-anti-sigma factor